MSSFIKKIYIEKLRHLKEIEIDITNSNEKKHLILTGKNGSGKTTLLENIKNYLKSLEANDFNYINFEAPKSIILNKTGSETGGNVEQREKCKKNLEYLKSRIEGYENGVKYTFNDIESLEEKYKNNEFIIASFSAKRKSDILVPTSVNKVELMEKYSIESDIDNKFLDYLVYLKTQQSFARNEEDIDTVNEIGEWFNNFEEALKNLFGDKSIKLKFDYRNLNFKISQEGREDYGLNELSDGFSASLDILMNLILRMEKERKGLAYNTEGIVLIDELETHLHIELQKNILPFLTKFFPKIQFIITTHSPFIINSLENVVVYDLEKKI
ncbi:MAG: AAA family ATPase, partial [Clostridium sp.]